MITMTCTACGDDFTTADGDPPHRCVFCCGVAVGRAEVCAERDKLRAEVEYAKYQHVRAAQMAMRLIDDLEASKARVKELEAERDALRAKLFREEEMHATTVVPTLRLLDEVEELRARVKELEAALRGMMAEHARCIGDEHEDIESARALLAKGEGR